MATIPAGDRPVNQQRGLYARTTRRPDTAGDGWHEHGTATDKILAALAAGEDIGWNPDPDGAAERGDRWGSKHL